MQAEADIEALEFERTALRAERDELLAALKKADEALCDYSCHYGPGIPCLRTRSECAMECGKRAGDALLAVRAAIAKAEGR